MELQLNIANVICVIKETRGVSLAEFSAEPDIFCYALQEYLSGTGKPNLSTIEHFAHKLGVDPVVFLTRVFTCDELQVLLIIVCQIRLLYKLDESTHALFAQNLWEVITLWNGSADDG